MARYYYNYYLSVTSFRANPTSYNARAIDKMCRSQKLSEKFMKDLIKKNELIEDELELDDDWIPDEITEFEEHKDELLSKNSFIVLSSKLLLCKYSFAFLPNSVLILF